jgi:serine/threonine protein kinase
VRINLSILGVAKMAWRDSDRLQGGKYTIEKELGRGRFGITYLVKNNNGDRFVIKTLNDDLLNSLNQLERERLKTMFLREALKLQKCKHKYIVEVVDSFEEADCLCLVMEYVNEVSLADLRPPTLSEPDALRYIQQIGEALIVVHENELIHRDVHPGNILLRKREGQLEAVLIDFGLALDFDHILTTSRTKETSDGFTPPELYARGTITRAYSDIYSLAATLYKLLTGRTPVDAVKRKVDGEHLVSPKEWNPQISEDTNRAILTGMKLDPKQRPQSMREWLDSLGLTGENLQPSVIEPSKTNSSWERNIQFWGVVIAAIAALGGLLAGVGAVMDKLKSPPSNSPPSVSPSPSSSKTP